MDDAFVLLAAWRRTPTSMTVSERLGHTYAEAAVSITITSLTNFISFMIGIITPFPSVSHVCLISALLTTSNAALLHDVHLVAGRAALQRCIATDIYSKKDYDNLAAKWFIRRCN